MFQLKISYKKKVVIANRKLTREEISLNNSEWRLYGRILNIKIEEKKCKSKIFLKTYFQLLINIMFLLKKRGCFKNSYWSKTESRATKHKRFTQKINIVLFMFKYLFFFLIYLFEYFFFNKKRSFWKKTHFSLFFCLLTICLEISLLQNCNLILNFEMKRKQILS